MSAETMEWLNNNTLIGFADDRSKWAGFWGVKDGENGLLVPWHALPGYTGSYPGPIPIEAVVERLMNWDAVKTPMFMKVPSEVTEAEGIDDEGNAFKNTKVDGFWAVRRDDTNEVMGVFKEGYLVHQFKEWLLDNVGNILDDTLAIESALLLQGGAVACVTVSLPEVVQGSAEFPILPRLMAYTSHNGKFSTTYQGSPYSPVCDNTMASAISEGGTKVKIKHSKYSDLKIATARQALGILYKQAEEMTEFFDKLAEWEITNQDFKKLINTIQPMPEAKVVDGKVTNQRSMTVAESRQTQMAQTYVIDPRANKWQGTALGALQAMNTWNQQVKDGLKSGRVERNVIDTMTGDFSEFDRIVLASLSDITGVEMSKDASDHWALTAVS